jgi:hypothetical protein
MEIEPMNHRDFGNGLLTSALTAGFAGATALTIGHEVLRHFRADAPRMDVVGGRALASLWRRAGARPPRGKSLYLATLAADLLSNTAYFAVALLGRPRHPYLRETAAGMVAGVSAFILPPILRLGLAPHSYRRSNRFLTVGLYLMGALVAAAAYRRSPARNGR